MMMDHETSAALAALQWQIELGATEAIGDAPVCRYEDPEVIAAKAAKPAKAAASPLPNPATTPPPRKPAPEAQHRAAVESAKAMAAAAPDLDALRAAMAAYEFCALKKGARNLVFADGNPLARVMVIGEAPGREEDREGRPFVGPAGQLLDKMFSAIGLSRGASEPEAALYITNTLPWRPPQNRDPAPEETAMLLPFLQRHIALVNPQVLVLMGNHAMQAVLGKTGILRLRGQWEAVDGVATLPMTHPAYLLRNPAAKREAWADLLSLKARLKG